VDGKDGGDGLVNCLASRGIDLSVGCVDDPAGRAEIFGVDAEAHPMAAHRRVAFVRGTVAATRPDTFTERFEFDPSAPWAANDHPERHESRLASEPGPFAVTT